MTFSEADWDIVISGRRRASHGKGVRAVLHAAFSLGLLGYCISNTISYPNFIVIDSPLVVYREPDTSDDSMKLDVKDAFYNDIASSFSEAQVIILENENPPTELEFLANIISLQVMTLVVQVSFRKSTHTRIGHDMNKYTEDT